ncbi:hypothetical protein GWI33_015711 [Rhynchophorus ferrugineus]|uniref:Uncharacterized protein n=1 Tax=Rhynchophorus ferrugineus TaxID=354439 RepID=A0A834M7U9_RHYFE|nr:hypothetical protein GWI33_015711 [Rhynchophorus ferrugineus]
MPNPRPFGNKIKIRPKTKPNLRRAPKLPTIPRKTSPGPLRPLAERAVGGLTESVRSKPPPPRRAPPTSWQGPGSARSVAKEDVGTELSASGNWFDYRNGFGAAAVLEAVAARPPLLPFPMCRPTTTFRNAYEFFNSTFIMHLSGRESCSWREPPPVLFGLFYAKAGGRRAEVVSHGVVFVAVKLALNGDFGAGRRSCRSFAYLIYLENV